MYKRTYRRFRTFAEFVKGHKKADHVVAWLETGSWAVEKQIRKEGLDKILTEAGFELRQPGCSACLAMNDDKVPSENMPYPHLTEISKGDKVRFTNDFGRTSLCAAAITGKLPIPEILCNNYYIIFLEKKNMTDKFKTLTSTCIPLPMENVDTDQIIPARFLKATTREGFGDNLFRDWRYDKEGNPIPDLY